MFRRIWVTPKELCNITGLTPDEVNQMKEEYCFDVQNEDDDYMIDLLDFCFIYKSTALARSNSILKDSSPIPAKAFLK